MIYKCYLVIGCFDLKICIFQQIVVTVHYILNHFVKKAPYHRYSTGFSIPMPLKLMTKIPEHTTSFLCLHC